MNRPARSRGWSGLAGEGSTSICTRQRSSFLSPLSITAGFLVLLFGLGAACRAVEPEGIETQTALGVEATLIAMQSAGEVQPTIEAQSLTMTAQTVLITEQAVQIGQQALALTQAPPAAVSPDARLPAPGEPASTPQPTITPLPSPTPTPTVDVISLGVRANILLYEDMAGVFNTSRTVKLALDDLGFPYVDTKDHIGQFKEALLDEAPEGKAWDLVISANEGRTRYTMIRGEFFTYLRSLLAGGSSVIIEAWNLDSLMDQPLRDLFNDCGVEYHGDMYDLRDQSLVFYSAYPNSPILTYPNQPPLYNVTNYWDLEGDLGDLLQLADGSKAQILLGRRIDFPTKYGTLTACMDGRLIIQTFSTHQYAQKDMIALWQNYIYNALKSHYQYVKP